MKFTIFGGSGFIGSRLSAYLSSLGHEVYVPGRMEIPDATENLGHVIYAIGMTGNTRWLPYETIDAHVTGLVRRLQYATFDSWLYLSSTRLYLQSSGVTTEASSVSVLPGGYGIYDISKLLGESICLAHENNKVRVARLSNVYGHGQSKYTFLGSLVHVLRCHRQVLIREAPESAKDYIAISDVVRLIEQIVVKGKERIYNVASGFSISHREIAAQMQELSDCPVGFEPGGAVRVFPPIDTDRIKEEFDFRPRHLLEELDEEFSLSLMKR